MDRPPPDVGVEPDPTLDTHDPGRLHHVLNSETGRSLCGATARGGPLDPSRPHRHCAACGRVLALLGHRTYTDGCALPA